jgi:hypothetical protein
MGSGGIASTFLTSTTDEGEWSALILGIEPTSSPFIGDWVGHRASFDTGEEKNLFPVLGIKAQLS